MPDTIRCPDCGHENPAGSLSCGRCNFPLQETVSSLGPTQEVEPEIVIRRPVRRRRPRAMANQSVTLWLVVGGIAAVALLWQGLAGYRKSNAPPVEGASEDQQRAADSLRAVLRRDSTNVDALIAYGNVLYDTANWAEAARYYARGIARDSTRVHAIVDLGVCYYNRSDMQRAEQLFQLALRQEPNQPVALFNLGIVNERGGDYETALKYFHRALEADSPEEMKQQIVQRMQQLLQKTGKAPPPLNQGGMPPGMSPAMPPGQTPPGGTGK
jgi:tetratricopeptide (TPR) repeat protein